MTNESGTDRGADMSPFFVELERQLVHAADRQQLRRRRRRRIVVAGLAAAAVIVVVVFGASLVDGGSDTAVAEVVHVEPVGEQLSVSIDAGAPASEAVAELRAAGFDVTESPLATGPSRVDRIVVIESVDVLPEGSPEEGYRFVGPSGAALTVLVGTATDTGTYEAPTDALLAGEPLHCVGWVGQAASDLAARAEGAGITTRFAATTPDFDPQALDGLVVQSASAFGPADVFVLLEPGTPQPQPPC